MKRTICLLFIYMLIMCLSMVLYNDLTVVIADIKKENTALINTEHYIREYINKITNGNLQNGDEKIIFDKLGENNIKAIFKNDLGKIIEEEIKVMVIDNIKPEIYYKDNYSIYEGDSIDLIKNVLVKDNSNEKIIPTIIGEYDTEKEGIYPLIYRAVDSSGNKSEVSFNLEVKLPEPTKDLYYVKINKTQNVLMIYKKDINGNYTKLYKTFVISAGNNTPVGVFKASTKSEVISFASGTWGRYATRIHNSFWFHSVPYNTKSKNGHWDSVLYNEYNKLGTLASAGCVRLAVNDAKWIYENIVSGTTIEIYESDSLPLEVIKPNASKINIESSNRGWDPTDPDIENPWNE